MADIKGIEFEVKGSSNEAVTGLEKLATTLTKIKSATSNGGFGLGQIAKELRSLNNAIQETDPAQVLAFATAARALGRIRISNRFASGLKDIGVASKSLSSGNLSKFADAFHAVTAATEGGSLSSAREALEQIAGIDFSNLDGIPEKISAIGAARKQEYELDDPTNQWAKDMAEQVEMKDTGLLDNLRDILDTSGIDAAKQAFQSLGTALSSVFERFRKTKDAADESKEAIKEVARQSRETSNAEKSVSSSKSPSEEKINRWHRLGEAIGGAGKKIGRMSLAGLSTPFVRAFSPIAKFSSKLKEVASSFKRVLFYRVVRSVIKEIGQAFNEGIKNLYGWSAAMGGAVSGEGLTFAQTLDDIATSLLYFKNSLAAAVAPLANLLRPAIESVTNAAVELLNVVNQLVARLTGQSTWNKAIRKATEYGDAVGGAGGKAKEALRYLAPFDELNVLPDDKNRGGGGATGDDYGGMFEEMEAFEDGISDFADRVKAAIESSNWIGLGTLLGEKVNDIIARIDFAEAGTKVGEKINALFTTEYWTLKSINFQKIGKKVAEFLTGEDGIGGALREIDFTSIGGAMAQKLTWVLEFAVGAINNFDFSVAGKSLGDLFRGFFDDISETIESIDWNATVQNFIRGFVDTIKGFDITGALNSVGNLFSKMAEAINKVDWGDAVSKLTKGLIEAIANIDITNLVNGALELAGAVIGGVIDGLGTLLVDIAEVITDPNTWKLVLAWMKDIPAKIKQLGIDIANKFVSPIVDGINKLISAYNGSALAEMFGEIPPISFNLIPDIPKEELTKNYDAAKKQLEEESREKKAQLSTNAKIVSAEDKLTDAQRKVHTVAEYSQVKSKLTSGQRTIPAFANFEESNDKLSATQRTFDSTAAFNVSKNGSKWNAASTTWSATAAFNTSKNGAKWNADSTTWSATAAFNKSVNGSKWSEASTTWDATAAFNKSVNGTKWNADSTTWSATAAFNKSKNGSQWSAESTTWNSTARFTKSTNGSNWTSAMTTWNSTANFTKVTASTALQDTDGKMVVSAKLKVVGQSGTPTISANLTTSTVSFAAAATGGVFSNGSWHSIPQYASGTTRAGSIFIAGEAGPEVVGHIGGRTEVLNRSQLAATMYSAVRSAMVGISLRVAGATATSETPETDTEDMLYRAFSRALADSDFGDIELDGDVVYKKMVSRNNANTRLTGVNAFA